MSNSKETHDLLDFIRSASRQIAEEYNRIQKRVKEDPGSAGDQGEENWATLLRNWLPHTFHIVTKGKIISETGVTSPQIDILILQPEYPQSLLDKKVYLAGGVLAAFECKITLKSAHIRDFVKNSIQIKRELPREYGTPYKELQSPIIYGLLAHSHSWTLPGSNPIANIEKAIWQSDVDLIKHPIEMPDILCVADLAVWVASKLVFWDEIMDSFLPTSPPFYSSGNTSSSYSLISIELNDAENFLPIGEMIKALLIKLAWEVPSLRRLASYFVSSGRTGVFDATKRRMWDRSVFSVLIGNRIDTEVKNLCDAWDEWCIAIN